jgi:hypothetical protein
MTTPTPQEIEVKLSEFCLIEYSAYLKERERNEELLRLLEAIRSQMCRERDLDQLTMGMADLHTSVTKALETEKVGGAE